MFDIHRWGRSCERENEELKEELEAIQWRQRQEEYERQQADYREMEKRRREREEAAEHRWYLHDQIQTKNEEIEDLRLRIKFGIEEGE